MSMFSADKPVVARINRKAFLIGTMALAGLIGISTIISMQKPKQKTEKEQQPIVDKTNMTIPESLKKEISYQDYLQPIPGAGAQKKRGGPGSSDGEEGEGEGEQVYLTDKECQTLFGALDKISKKVDALEQKLSVPPPPPISPEQEEQKEMERKARMAGLDFQNVSQSNAQFGQSSSNISQVEEQYKQIDKQVSSLSQSKSQGGPKDFIPGGAQDGVPLTPDATELQSMQHMKQKFVDQASANSQNYVNAKLESPLSKFEVKATAIIPVTLITGLNSDIPGNVVAQVRENVYDTVSGKYLLIPQGTRIMGAYDSVVAYGQNRLLLVFTRLIMPNGNSINLEGMPGIDMSGYAGLKDRVNHHWVRLITGVILSSMVSAAASYAEKDNLNDGTGNVYLQSMAETTGRIGEKIAEKNLNIQPTIQIRPGWNFNIFVHKDMILKPYKI